MRKFKSSYAIYQNLEPSLTANSLPQIVVEMEINTNNSLKHV